jgi:hypothetical protein
MSSTQQGKMYVEADCRDVRVVLTDYRKLPALAPVEEEDRHDKQE